MTAQSRTTTHLMLVQGEGVAGRLRGLSVIGLGPNGQPPNFLSDFGYVLPEIRLAPLSLNLSLAGFLPEKF
jgi:hypothetical protein